MKEYFALCFILIILFLIGGYGLRRYHLNPSRDNLLLFALITILFTIIYTVGLLDFKISGKEIAIERKLEAIQKISLIIDQKAEAVSQLSSILIDASSKKGGLSKEERNQILELKGTLDTPTYRHLPYVSPEAR